MIARVITSGVAIARGVGGRRGRAGERRDAQRLKLPIAALLPEVYGFKVGKRERRRRADLRRRARDRAIAVTRGMLRHFVDPWRRACELDRVRAGRVAVPWWSTPEGRRRWTEDDRARKRARREM